MSQSNSSARIAFLISTRPGRPATANPIYHGALLAIEECRSDASLLVALDWEVLDDFGDTAKSKEFAAQIVGNRAFVAVVGPMGSNEALATAPVFHEAGLLQISPCASHPSLCQQGFRTFFRLVANEEVQGRELARMAHGYLGARRVAIVSAEDAWGWALTEIFARHYSALGGIVVGQQTYLNGVTEFSNLIRATAATSPDLVMFAVHPMEGPAISTGLRGAGLKVPFLGTDAMKTAFPLGGGEPDAEAYHTHSGADFRHLPSAAAFREAFTACFPEDSTYSPEAYDAIMIVAFALRQAGSPDRARVLDVVRTLQEFPGVSGPVSFSPTGERVGAPIGFYRVRRTTEGREMVYLGMTSNLLLTPSHPPV